MNHVTVCMVGLLVYRITAYCICVMAIRLTVVMIKNN